MDPSGLWQDMCQRLLEPVQTPCQTPFMGFCTHPQVSNRLQTKKQSHKLASTHRCPGKQVPGVARIGSWVGSVVLTGDCNTRKWKRATREHQTRTHFANAHRLRHVLKRPGASRHCSDCDAEGPWRDRYRAKPRCPAPVIESSSGSGLSLVGSQVRNPEPFRRKDRSKPKAGRFGPNARCSIIRTASCESIPVRVCWRKAVFV